ncbi:DUF4245 domain-containing protein [Streptomyces sp. B-S-A8]|uniref:DUF4245 domain-containing protein n=1 Tax=Streptomyces solicavernae TaxID=3043614 RepID=A0ABT6RZE4_9ACTN|nr:DUF4245 domain-containing protein [Streptomyces sp. B-S-A8]MDI3389809.1 DUF4245 domain-containing protein [Streptomyces sp. B-S-A8]
MAGMRGTKTLRDMVLSLAVIGAVVAVIYVFIPHDESQNPVKAVSYDVELATAQRAATYPILAPEGLGKGWKATSVRFDGAEQDHWHLGFHGPDDQYIAIEQSTEKTPVFVDDVTRGAEETARSERIDGATWTRYEGETYDALVRTEKGATTVVTGSATFAQLAEMAGALK